MWRSAVQSFAFVTVPAFCALCGVLRGVCGMCHFVTTLRHKHLAPWHASRLCMGRERSPFTLYRERFPTMANDTIHAVSLGGFIEADIVYSTDEGGWYADMYLLPSCESLGITPTGRIAASAADAIRCARRFALNYRASRR